MRAKRTILLAIAALALAVAGCGGSEVSADEVPGSPPALTVPSDSELGAGGDDADAAAGSESGTDDPATPEDESATTDPAVPEDTAPAPEDGAAVPEDTTAAPEETAADPAQPEADAPVDQFESFCEQNAGAC